VLFQLVTTHVQLGNRGARHCVTVSEFSPQLGSREDRDDCRRYAGRDVWDCEECDARGSSHVCDVTGRTNADERRLSRALECSRPDT
jgi:hypothetical protein